MTSAQIPNGYAAAALAADTAWTQLAADLPPPFRPIATTLAHPGTWSDVRYSFEAAASRITGVEAGRDAARSIILEIVRCRWDDDAATDAADIWGGVFAEQPYVARTLADIEPEPIRWLWPQRIALGKLSLLAGQPGRGKSQLSLAIASTVSRGGNWPDGSRAGVGSVILVNCEDDAADTIRPRAEVAGAHLARIHTLDAVREGDGKRPLSLAADAAVIERMVSDLGDCALVIIDPITAYLGRIDSRDAPQVRGVLQPLVDLAQRTGAGVLLVSHLNKGGEGRTAMERVTGSGAFVAVCRSAWLVEREGDKGADEGDVGEPGRHVLAPLKNNLGDDRTAFAYVIETAATAGGITTSRVRWLPGTLTISADELLARARQVPVTEDTSALGEATRWLAEALAGGPRLANETFVAARAARITERTLRRASDALGVVKRRNGEGGAWTWLLPDTTSPRDELGATIPELGQGGQHGQPDHVGPVGQLRMRNGNVASMVEMGNLANLATLAEQRGQ